MSLNCVYTKIYKDAKVGLQFTMKAKARLQISMKAKSSLQITTILLFPLCLSHLPVPSYLAFLVSLPHCTGRMLASGLLYERPADARRLSTMLKCGTLKCETE